MYFTMFPCPCVWQNDVAFANHFKFACMTKPGVYIRKFHACTEFYKLGTHHLLRWLIAKVQGPLVYLYIESVACKKYSHGLLDLGVIWWCTTSSVRSTPQANHVLVYTSTQLPPNNHMPLWYTLYTSVWPHTRHSVWVFRCFFIARGSHPAHMPLLLHHSTLSD